MRPFLGPESMSRLHMGIAISLVAIVSGCASSIHDAVAGGTPEEVRALLQSNPALVNAPAPAKDTLGRTPLHYAVRNHRVDMLDLLLEFGADLNARDTTGMTPLHIAAWMGLKEETQWLLAHGAELEPLDQFGDTPVHTAAIFYTLGSGPFGYFAGKGADLEAKNHEGLTPLDLARKYRNEKAAAYLEKRLPSQR